MSETNVTLHKFSSINGVRLHYVEKGEPYQDPLLFIHGLGAYSYTWRKNLGPLSRQFHVIALDLKGFGFSDKPREQGYSLSSHTELVRSFIDNLGVAPVNIAGNSMGGEIALRLAGRYPDRVNKLVLIAPSCFITRLPYHAYALRYLPYKRFIRTWLRHKYLNSRRLFEAVKNAFYDRKRISEQEIKNFLLPVFLDGFDEAFIRVVREFDFGRDKHLYQKIKHPSLIIAGEKDHVIPLSHLERLCRELANSKIIRMRETGHFPHEERHEQVNQLISDFIGK
ncbi:MAG: alpha/beta hydrolase [Bacillaceae bacterium]|nr:alpha/beta hydrolase [Bacillaceae bacterium]